MQETQQRTDAARPGRFHPRLDERARRASSIVAAPVLVSVIWLVASRLLDVELIADVGAEARPVGLVSIVATALLAGLAGSAVVVALTALNPRPRRTWLVISVTVLVLSLAGPLLATTPSAGVTLALMHLATAAVLIPGLMPAGPERGD